MYFVHGLGGHAFNTWSTDPDDHTQTCMWPRDILPKYLEESGIFGRYSTFGYPAGWFGSKSSGRLVKQSIEDAASWLFNDIANSRSGETVKSLPLNARNALLTQL